MPYISPATVASVEPDANRLVIRFTGDAGEPPVLLQYNVDDSATPGPDLRRWVYAMIRRLNSKRGGITSVTQGQNITELAPAAPAGPTAKDVWLGKARRAAGFVGVGLSGAAAAALATLQADINATFQAGFLDE